MSGEQGGWRDEPSILIFADADKGRAAALAAAESIGARVIGSETIDAALDRLSRQASVDSVLIELDGNVGPMRDRLLGWANHAAREGLSGAVIVLPQAQIDDVMSLIDEPNVILLCDPTAEERAAALGFSLAERRHKLHDQSFEADAERLRRLSEDVARIATTLAELSNSARTVAYTPQQPRSFGDHKIDAATVRGLIRVRRLRDQFFPKDLFADPAWDMLLDLMAARLEKTRVAVSSLCIAAAVPPTTALRWIRTLTEHGLFLRQADPEDGRRIFVELSDAAADALTAYFGAAQHMGFRTPVA